MMEGSPMQIALCIGCGCHDARACVDRATGAACSWLAVDYSVRRGVCSACPGHLGRWRCGDRIVATGVSLGLTSEQRQQAVDLMLAKWKAAGFVLDAPYLASLDLYVAGEINLRHVALLASRRRSGDRPAE